MRSDLRTPAGPGGGRSHRRTGYNHPGVPGIPYPAGSQIRPYPRRATDQADQARQISRAARYSVQRRDPTPPGRPMFRQSPDASATYPLHRAEPRKRDATDPGQSPGFFHSTYSSCSGPSSPSTEVRWVSVPYRPSLVRMQ